MIAGSFSETYKRNAFNNGYLVIEIPELVDFLKKKQSDSTDHHSTTAAATIKTGLRATIDFKKAELHVAGQTFTFPVVGTIAQEIVLQGGLENWVKHKMQQQQQK